MDTTAPLQGIESPQQRSRRLRFWGFVIAILAAILAVGSFWWTRRLSPLESRLVKTWAIPLPPNCPANVIQQTWMLKRSGRVSHAMMSGIWQVNDDVLECTLRSPLPDQVLYLIGQGPRPPSDDVKWRILEVTETSLTIQDLESGHTLHLIAIENTNTSLTSSSTAIK